MNTGKRATRVNSEHSLKPIQNRLLVPLAGVLLLLLGTFVVTLIAMQQRILLEDNQKTLKIASNELTESLNEQTRALAAIGQVLIDKNLRKVLKSKNRQHLFSSFEPIYAQLHKEFGITHFYFHLPNRVNLLRVHKPEIYNDLINRFTAREAERTGVVSTGIELGPLGTFTLRSVQPVFDGDELLGYLELGKEIEDILASIHNELLIEVAVTIHKSVLNQTLWEKGRAMLGQDANWEQFADSVLIYSSLPKFPAESVSYVDEKNHTHQETTHEVKFNNASWNVLISPLYDVSGSEVGDLIAFNNVTRAKARFIWLITFLAAGGLLVLAVLFRFLLVLLRRTDQGILKQQIDLKLARDASEIANKSKSEFLANMSHDIRTPLNGILGMLELMQTTSLNAEQTEFTLAAIQSSTHLNNVLSDILDLSRVEAGKLNIQNKPFDLSETLTHVVEFFDSTARQTDVELHCHIDPAIPQQLIGDPARLHQILNNLVGNALKFTKVGSVTVEAYPLPANNPEQYRVLFSISDTGIGIPSDKLDLLFDAFTQVDEVYTQKSQGVGLGLAICKHLVALMDGNISIASEVNVGTTFHFCITFGTAEHPLKKPSAAKEIHDVSLMACKILLAEDDRINSLVIKRQLGKEGCEVTVVEDGQQALAALRKQSFDIVLMDVQMPVMDGIEATKAIRKGKAGKHNKLIPIIALTAFAMVGDREKFLHAGMDEYASKPIEIKNLKQLLKKIINKKRAGNS